MSTATDRSALYQLGRWLLAQGISCIPVDKAKSPARIKTWKQYQTQLPTTGELARWVHAHWIRHLAVVTGRLSRLVAFDFDQKDPAAFVWPEWYLRVRRIYTGPLVSEPTPSGGVHVYFRVDEPGPSTTLAARPLTDRLVVPTVELMAENRSLTLYRREGWPKIPEISPATYSVMQEIARELDARPRPVAPKPTGPRTAYAGESDIRWFNQTYPLTEVLIRHGYRPSNRPNRMIRPGSDHGSPSVAIVLGRDGQMRSQHWNPGDPLYDCTPDSFEVFKRLEHGGDLRAALAEVRRMRYG